MVTKVIEEYKLEGKLIHIKSVNSGNINKTYAAYFEKEDETDLSKVGFDFELFKTYTDGYMSGIAQYITQEELSLVSESIRIITLELAM